MRRMTTIARAIFLGDETPRSCENLRSCERRGAELDTLALVPTTAGACVWRTETTRTDASGPLSSSGAASIAERFF